MNTAAAGAQGSTAQIEHARVGPQLRRVDIEPDQTPGRHVVGEERR